MYGRVIIVNNTVLYTWKLLREQILNVLTGKKKWWLYDMMEVLDNAMVIIILQCISVSNQHIVHIKLTSCYMSIIS